MVRCSLKNSYWQQKTHAKQRGIEFLLSFEEWVDWWGEDIVKRGRGKDKLQMCRVGDVGAYCLGNIYKGTHSQNSADKFANGFKAKKKATNDEELIGLAFDMGVSSRKVAELFGISQRTALRVKNGVGVYA